MYQNDFYSFPYGYGSYNPAYQFENAAAGATALGSARRGGNLLSHLFRLRRTFNFANFLTNTQKTLGVINQAIPIVYQVKPIWNNAKTMFKVMGALKESDPEPVTNTSSLRTQSFTPNNDAITPSSTPIEPVVIENQPQFFL